MQVDIDERSGFCFGVANAIKTAENELIHSGHLYCLGKVVHNEVEVDRLTKIGLEIIDYEQFKILKNCKVLIRAHGEPPETYQIAKINNIELLDASCKVVLKLQDRVKKSYSGFESKGQVVIFGKEGHAEVKGLAAQTEYQAIIVKNISDLEKIDFTKPVSLYSQTTMALDDFIALSIEIKKRMLVHFNESNIPLKINDTICRQVSNRAPQLSEFAKKYDVVIFAAGKESSNGKILYDVCKKVNINTYFVSEISEIQNQWFKQAKLVGICGATSTPEWLMKEIASYIKSQIRN